MAWGIILAMLIEIPIALYMCGSPLHYHALAVTMCFKAVYSAAVWLSQL